MLASESKYVSSTLTSLNITSLIYKMNKQLTLNEIPWVKCLN